MRPIVNHVFSQRRKKRLRNPAQPTFSIAEAMRGVCGIKMRVILAICGMVMLAMVVWIAVSVTHDGRPEEEVFVPGAWATTTTESIMVVTQIRIDPRPRSDLRYRAKKPGRIQVLRRVRRDMTGNWKRVNSPHVAHGKNENGRLVNRRPADPMEDTDTHENTQPLVSGPADETAVFADRVSSTADPDPVSYLPEDESLSTVAPSGANISCASGSSKRGDDRKGYDCWSRKTTNVAWRSSDF